MTPPSGHALAEQAFVQRYVRPPVRAVRASIMAPFDLALYGPAGRTLLGVNFVKIETVGGHHPRDLSPSEVDFARFAEAHGSAYLVAFYEVSGGKVLAEELHRPFTHAPSAEAEIVLEVEP